MLVNTLSLFFLMSYPLNAMLDEDELTRTTSSHNLMVTPAQSKSFHEIQFEREIAEAARHSYEKNIYIEMHHSNYPTPHFIKKVNLHWRKTHENLSDAMISARAMGKSRDWVMREFSTHYRDLILVRHLILQKMVKNLPDTIEITLDSES